VVILGNFVLLQLFLAILIENFSKASEVVAEEFEAEKKKKLKESNKNKN